MSHVGRWFPMAFVVAVCVTAAVLLASPDARSQALDDLDDDDATMRAEAIQYFASQGVSGLSDLLDDLADDHSALATAGLVDAILKIGIGASDVSDVATLLTSTDAPTRHGAVRILASEAAAARSNLEEVAKNAAEPTLIRAAAAAALGGAGAQARAALLDLVREDDAPGAVRKAAIQALARISTAGAADVGKIAAAVSEPWEYRQVAIHALGHPSAPSGQLAYLLTSTDPKMRAAVVAALVRQGGAANLALVAGKVTDLAANVRYAALQGVMTLGGAKANRTTVIGRLIDADPRVQALAAKLVGQTCADIASTVRPSLAPLLASTNFQVRCAAALALRAHGDKSGAATMQADAKSTNASQAIQALAAYNTIQGQ